MNYKHIVVHPEKNYKRILIGANADAVITGGTIQWFFHNQ